MIVDRFTLELISQNGLFFNLFQSYSFTQKVKNKNKNFKNFIQKLNKKNQIKNDTRLNIDNNDTRRV